MARSKTIPDSSVFSALRHLLATEGPQAASLRAIGRATGLAAATLVQRYGSAEALLITALQDGWDLADAALAAAVLEAPRNEKGVVVLLKALPPPPPWSRHAAVLVRAAQWRKAVTRELALRMGGRTQEAAILFAAWQGRQKWEEAGIRGFSLRDAVRSLT